MRQKRGFGQDQANKKMNPARLTLIALLSALLVLSAWPALAAPSQSPQPALAAPSSQSAWPALAAPAFAAEAGLSEPAAAGDDDTGSDGTGTENEAVISKKDLVFADDSALTGITQIPLTFYDTSDHLYTWEFPYTDDFFRHPSHRFSVTMARGSQGLAVSSFRNDKEDYTPGFTEFFEKAGFSEVESFGYDEPTTADSISIAIASKKIDDMTVIAAVSCSSGYGKEWASNFLVGTGVRHEGFENGAKKMEARITEYIRDHHIKGKKKLWLGGHSRGAGIANITAADMIKSGQFKDVYAYLSGVPRTTTRPVNYPGIYNICGKADVVTIVPLSSWGFERYGTDLYTPSQSTDSCFPDLAGAASPQCRKLTGDPFRNDPRLAYQYHLIVSFMGNFFPTPEDYAEEFQGILMDTWTEPDKENIFLLLQSAMSRMKTLNAQEKKASRFFIRYLSSVMDNLPEIEDDSWDSTDGVADNMMREHRPSTYITWMNTRRDPAQLLEGPSLTRRVVLIGDMDLEVYLDDILIGSLKKNGKMYMLYDDSDNPGSKDAPCPFLQRTGEQTVADLPQDRTYTLRVTQPRTMKLIYYDLIYDHYEPQVDADYIYTGALKAGTYEMTVIPGEPLSDLKSVDTGEEAPILRNPYAYSPVNEMQMETDTMRYGILTVNQMNDLLIAVLAGLLLLPVVCIILALLHSAGRRRGHPPYSHWYVIVPHLLVIMTFTVLTYMFSLYLLSYGKVMMACIAVVDLFLLLLSLRALLRNRNLYTIILSGVYLLLTIFVSITAYREPMSAYTDLNMYFFIAAVTVCSALAALGFYIRPGASRRGRGEDAKAAHSGAL